MTRTQHLHGVVLPDLVERDLFIVDRKLTLEPQDDFETIVHDGYLIPGLVDAHAHLPFASPAPEEASWAEKAVASARVHLDAGVLTVRDPGGPTPTGLGPRDGLPRTITAGRFLAAPGMMFPEHGQRELPEEQIPDAAEEEFASSGSWVKLIGDFIDPSGRMATSFRPETLADAARRVHALGGRITIHAFLDDTIDAAIDAGFDCIEHGVMLREDQVEAMAARDMALVPTLRTGLEMWPQIVQFVPTAPEEKDRVAKALSRYSDAVRTAWEAGVTILAGTDAGLVSHGLVRLEVEALIAAGIPPIDAIAAASWGARTYLGLPGLEESAPADVVAFDRNPLEDSTVLAEPRLIVLDGRVVRRGVPAVA
ncbi:MAG TPA: amidohydrolase family protein [Candidatus Limnocylindria bacterium]|nr:amidohydrolase family protein [Candidatus Limnocylindria bacterium]